MKILAIESFTDNKYLTNSAEYLEENHLFIEKLYREEKIKLCWSRDDKPGNVLMMEADSVDEVKKLLKTSPLFEKKIITYSVIPMKDYPFNNSYSKEKNNFVLIYVSAQTKELNSYELKNILKTARKRNPKLHVTGMLVYQKGSFLQVLEGDRNKVEALFNKIESDSRHKKVAKVTTYYTADRLFSDWSMGFADVTEDELESIQGLNDFFKSGNSLTNIKEEEAKNILQAFKEGRWRQHIS